MDSVTYRAKNWKKLDLLDDLERTGYLKNAVGEYVVTLPGLSMLRFSGKRELIRKCEVLFSTLKIQYRLNPRKPIKVSELSDLTKVPARETEECLRYMVQGQWWHSHSLGTDQPDREVCPAESIFRYRSFREVMAKAEDLRGQLLSDRRVQHRSTPGAESLLRLEGVQNVLYESLAKRNPQLAEIYLGAIHVLFQQYNPDRLALAAHALRELMEKLPLSLDLPVKKKQASLKEQVREFAKAWAVSLGKTRRIANDDWDGVVDGPLRGFLRKAKEFFVRFESDFPARKQQTLNVLRGLDLAKMPLPAPIEKLRIEEWDECNSYFQGVAHHTISTTFDEFSSWLTSFERFLLDQLRPRTFDDHTKLDAIIREAEKNDQP